MASINKAILVGNLGQDPELRYTQSGKAVTNFSLATTFGFGEDAETEWHRVTAWDKTAEAVAKYLKKGSKAYVEGRIKTRKYEDKEGVTRYQTEIIAFDVQFLDSKPTSEPAQEEAPAKRRKTTKAKSQPREEEIADEDIFGEE